MNVPVVLSYLSKKDMNASRFVCTETSQTMSGGVNEVERKFLHTLFMRTNVRIKCNIICKFLKYICN